MGNLNYIGGIAKILEIPSSIQLSPNDLSLYFIRFRAQFSFTKKKYVYPTVTLIIWGNLAHEIMGYYKVNDYVLIEGHVFIKLLRIENYFEKRIEINVTKIFPLSFETEI